MRKETAVKPRYYVAETSGYPIMAQPGERGGGQKRATREVEVMVLDRHRSHRVVRSFIGFDRKHGLSQVHHARLAARSLCRRLNETGEAWGTTSKDLAARRELVRLWRLGVRGVYLGQLFGIHPKTIESRAAKWAA